MDQTTPTAPARPPGAPLAFDLDAFDKLVAAGFTAGLGKPHPGLMCVEAAVCYALGEPHGDEPTCVHSDVQDFVVRLNDASWGTAQVRAQGMRDLAVAQLGTAAWTDEQVAQWVDLLAEQVIRQVLPRCAKHNPSVLERCRIEGSVAAARQAADALDGGLSEIAGWAAGGREYGNSQWVARAIVEAHSKDPGVLVLGARLALDALRVVGSPGLALLGGAP